MEAEFSRGQKSEKCVERAESLTETLATQATDQGRISKLLLSLSVSEILLTVCFRILLNCTELVGYKITHSLVPTNLRFYCVFRNEPLPDFQ